MGAACEQLPLPRKPTFTGIASAALSIASMFQRPDVMVVPLEPSVGPKPPPKRVVMPLQSAASACCGEMKWICESIAPAVRIRCSPDMASVAAPVTRLGDTPCMMLGLPALPMPAIFPSLMPTSALMTPSTASMIVTLVITRSNAPCSEVKVLARAIPSRRVLPPPYTTSSP